METLSLIAGIVYMLALIALIYFLQDTSKTLKQAKQQVRSLQDICDIGRENNEKLFRNNTVAEGYNERLSRKINHINSIRKSYGFELNLMENMRQEFEAAIKPIDRSRKKKIRGKRRK